MVAFERLFLIRNGVGVLKNRWQSSRVSCVLNCYLTTELN